MYVGGRPAGLISICPVGGQVAHLGKDPSRWWQPGTCRGRRPACGRRHDVVTHEGDRCFGGVVVPGSARKMMWVQKYLGPKNPEAQGFDLRRQGPLPRSSASLALATLHKI
jgi:hypothetical protein